VGNGPFPTELKRSDGRAPARVGTEFGSTTGASSLRVVDIPACASHAAVCIQALALTKLDVLSGLIRSSSASSTGWQARRSMRCLDPDDLAAVEPVYTLRDAASSQAAFVGRKDAACGR